VRNNTRTSSSAGPAQAQNERCWGLLRRRQCLVPTWRGWLLLVLGLVVLVAIAVREVHPFLAVTKPVTGGLLVVEGWAPDYALEAAVEEFSRNHYDRIYVIGGPLEHGGPLAEYRTLAERGAATLLKLGLTTNAVQAVPAPLVRQDRTYAAAVSLRNWLRQHGISANKVHLLSEGAHARRSRLLVEKAMGPGAVVGVTSITDKDYDPQRWWRSSAGVRTVISEALAYAYARCLFRAPKE
jgi:hypothetical protein